MEFKSIAGRIPDDAQVIKLCESFIAWRKPNGKLSCYSFHPEKLNEEI